MANPSPCTTCYLTYDHLGTARLITDASAATVARHDYLPFGEEIPANTAGRDLRWGPFNDSVSEKFTGKERIRNRASITLGRGTTGVRWVGLRVQIR